jgi:hypothetical protein
MSLGSILHLVHNASKAIPETATDPFGQPCASALIGTNYYGRRGLGQGQRYVWQQSVAELTTRRGGLSLIPTTTAMHVLGMFFILMLLSKILLPAV